MSCSVLPSSAFERSDQALVPPSDDPVTTMLTRRTLGFWITAAGAWATGALSRSPDVQAANVAAIRRQNDLRARGDVDGAAAMFAEESFNHGCPTERARIRALFADIRTTFPDQARTIGEITAIDDQVVYRGTTTATHLGTGKVAANGGMLVGVPPTGKRFTVTQTHWFWLRDGLIVAHRANRDDLGMLVQLGLLPAPPAGTGPAPAPVPPRQRTYVTGTQEQARNSDVLRALGEAWNRHDIDAVMGFWATGTPDSGHPIDPQAMRLTIADIQATFPDARLDTEELVAVDDYVIIRRTFSGTHLGVGRRPVNGGMLVGVAPTGMKFAVQQIHWYTLRGGRIVHHYSNRDDLGMMVQLGLLSLPA